MNCRLPIYAVKGLGRFVLVLGLLFLSPPAWGALTFPHQGAISPPSELDVGHYGPRVAVDDQGNAYALWVDNRNGRIRYLLCLSSGRGELGSQCPNQGRTGSGQSI